MIKTNTKLRHREAVREKHRLTAADRQIEARK